MRGGALRNVITIEEKSETGRDKLNAPIIEWIPFAEDVFCEKLPRRGAEHFDPASRQRFSQVGYRFRCRFYDVEGVNEAMRVVHEGKNYDIRAVLPDDQRHDEIVIDATLQE